MSPSPVIIKTETFVAAILAQTNQIMVRAMLVRRGDPDNGAIIVRLDMADGCRVETRQFDPEAGYRWCPLHEQPKLGHGDVETVIKRQISYDPDCWIIAVDTEDGINPFAQYEQA